MIIELSLSPGYVHDWTVSDAIREFMQNAIDSDDFTVNYKDSVLTISNAGNLRRETILLGASSKTGDNKTVGQFGEGYKIGLLVLCRNEFKPLINIYSNYRLETWRAFIENSEAFKSDVLKIEINEFPDQTYGQRVEFVIPDFSKELYAEMVKNTLQLRTEPLEMYETSLGDILLDPSEKGRIYVNGLFLCKSTNEKIGYGYNIKPQHLKVDRDRRLISDFNIFWITSQMWIEAREEKTDDVVVKNVMDNIPDMQYILSFNYTSTNKVNKIANSTYNAVKKLYNNENVIIVKDQKEFDTLVDKHGHDPKDIKYVEENTYNLIKTSSTYKHPEPKNKDIRKGKSPVEVLNDLYDKLDKLGVDQEVLDAVEEVTDEAANWTIQVEIKEEDTLPF